MTNTYEYNRINGLKIIFNLVKQHGIHSNVCYSNHSPNQKHINLIRFGSKKFHIIKWTCVHFHCLIRRFKDIIMPAWLKKEAICYRLWMDVRLCLCVFAYERRCCTYFGHKNARTNTNTHFHSKSMVIIQSRIGNWSRVWVFIHALKPHSMLRRKSTDKANIQQHLLFVPLNINSMTIKWCSVFVCFDPCLWSGMTFQLHNSIDLCISCHA